MSFNRHRLTAATILLWLLVAVIATRIELVGLTEDTTRHDGATALLVEETRQAIGQNLYRTSDAYFHRGMRAQPHGPRREDAFSRLHDHIQPRRHVHLGDREVAEILPWLQAAIRMDPGNIEAWRVAAFWLASPSIGRPDQAIRLLHQAAQRYPSDYRPLLDIARLQLRSGDIDRAIRSLDQALDRWQPDPPRSDPREALLEFAELQHYRGLCAEIQGDHRRAIDAYGRILEHFPERSNIAKRRTTLKQGRTPDLPPRAWILELTEHDDDHHDHHDCDHNHHPHGHASGHPHPHP